MSELFGVSKSTISEHLSNVYTSGELEEEATVRKSRTVQKEGRRDVTRVLEYYNLDVIISIGYRVNSQQATRFRQWATKTLKEYLIKGFVLDNDRLKQGKNLFDKDYFDELVEKIREIRASERRFYQKITDIYATSFDYDSKAPITRQFFATVQNKLEFAITKHTAPEIIKLRASSKKPNMGLTSWKNEGTGGKILKTDVSVAKNYLNKDEITELNLLVNMYLDYAELQANRNSLMKMQDWVGKLNGFLQFNQYNILKAAGRVKATVAKTFAESEYSKFRVIQDKEFESDFDQMVKKVNNKNIPKETDVDKPLEPLSDFNQKLKKGLDYNPKEEK